MYISIYVIFEHTLKLYFYLKGGYKLYKEYRVRIIAFVTVLSIIHFTSIVIEIVYDCQANKEWVASDY